MSPTGRTLSPGDENGFSSSGPEHHSGSSSYGGLLLAGPWSSVASGTRSDAPITKAPKAAPSHPDASAPPRGVPSSAPVSVHPFVESRLGYVKQARVALVELI